MPAVAGSVHFEQLQPRCSVHQKRSGRREDGVIQVRCRLCFIHISVTLGLGDPLNCDEFWCYSADSTRGVCWCPSQSRGLINSILPITVSISPGLWMIIKKKQPNVREKMVIYSQVASSVYGLHAHKHTRTHTCTYALSHTPVTSGYTVRGCAWGSCFVSPVQTDDWSGRLSGSSNQEWKWSYDSL